MSRSYRSCLFSIATLAALAVLPGCGSSEPQNVVENADQAAIQSYEEMVAAEEAMMSEDPGDSQ